jgi:NAD(P)H-flavin reductase
MSQHINDLKPGQTLAFKGPIVKFPYKANEFSHGVCVSGGSGITPMYQLISHALSIPEDKTKFTLMFANVTEKDILLRKEWDTLAKEHPDRFKVVYTVDKAPYFWKGEHTGRGCLHGTLSLMTPLRWQARPVSSTRR